MKPITTAAVLLCVTAAYSDDVQIDQRPGFASVLAPVRNSLDDTLGVAEVVTRTNPVPRENVK